AIAALGTEEDAAFTSDELVPMAAHPARATGSNACDEGIVRDVMGNHGAGAHEGVATDGHAADDGSVGADGGAPADARRLDEGAAIDRSARVDDVREDGGRSQEDVVLDQGAIID